MQSQRGLLEGANFKRQRPDKIQKVRGRPLRSGRLASWPPARPLPLPAAAAAAACWRCCGCCCCCGTGSRRSRCRHAYGQELLLESSVVAVRPQLVHQMRAVQQRHGQMRAVRRKLHGVHGGGDRAGSSGSGGGGRRSRGVLGLGCRQCHQRPSSRRRGARTRDRVRSSAMAHPSKNSHE